MLKSKKKTRRLKGKTGTPLVRSDVNLEKWSIFTTKGHRGPRTLTRQKTLDDGTNLVQTVTISGKEGQQTLTTEDGKFFYLLLYMWEQQGQNPDGIIRSSVYRLLNSLVADKKDSVGAKVRRGNWSKSWLQKKIDKLVDINLDYRWAYKNRDDTLRAREKFTLISRYEIFERKTPKPQSQPPFDFSSFTIHPTIIKSIQQKNIKPLRFDVLRMLKKEISLILYRFLDLMLSDKMQYERDVAELAEELDFGASRSDNLLQQIRESCRELEGKDITTGCLAYCRIEPRASGRGWKLVARKGKQSERLDTVDRTDPEETSAFKKLEWAAERYQSLSADQRVQVNALRDEIIETKYSGWKGEFTQRQALADAIERLASYRHEPPNVPPLASKN